MYELASNALLFFRMKQNLEAKFIQKKIVLAALNNIYSRVSSKIHLLLINKAKLKNLIYNQFHLKNY